MTADETNDSDGAPVRSARLRKNRNRFTVLPAPESPMSRSTVRHVATGELNPDVEHLAGWFLGQESARERFSWALRDSLDELLDGQRTGRWCYQHLTKTEKTYLGTAIEINLGREFDLDEGNVLDWRINGEDIDCKFSKDLGGWEIPMEMYQCLDHDAQSGQDDHVALLVWMDDDGGRWAAGLLRIADSLLRFRKDGSRAYNRDNKRKLNDKGFGEISWLWGGIQEDLPQNLLLHLEPEVRDAVFDEAKSGQERVNTLLRMVTSRLISRATILAVAQQDDPLKRVRQARQVGSLGHEGYIVLGHQEADPIIAELLGLPVPLKGEFVSIRVAPVGETDERPKVFLADRWWAVASSDDDCVTAPPRQSFRGHGRETLTNGPSTRTHLD